MTYCETYFGTHQVFSDVAATVSEDFWQQISEHKWTVLEKLQMDTSVSYLENTDNGSWVIKGNFYQISHAQRLLNSYINTTEGVATFSDGNSFSFTYMPADFNTAPSAYVNVIAKPECEDKEVSCDIIKANIRKSNRFTYASKASSTVAALTVKEKYKTQRNKSVSRRKTLQAVNNDQKENRQTCNAESSSLNADRLEIGTINVEVIDGSDDSFKVNLSKHQVSLLDPNQVLTLEPDGTKDEDKTIKSYRSKDGREGFKFSCKMCSFQSNRESHLAKHIQIHDKVNTLYNCDKCNFTTIRLSHLRRHAISHSQTVYNCDFCTYKSNELKLLARHMKVKHANDEEILTPVQVLECSYCSYKTTKPYFYQRHMRVHCADKKLTNIVAYQCDQCDYKTNRREHYIRHINDVHTNKRPFLCDFCGKAFKRPDALKQHKQTHDEPIAETRTSHYKCNVCQKKCRSQASLREHLAVHSSDRSFLCEFCGTSFKTRSVQRKHVITIHKNPRSYSCHRCEKRFNTNFALRRHLRLHQTNNETRSGSQPAFLNDTAASQISQKPLESSDNLIVQENVLSGNECDDRTEENENVITEIPVGVSEVEIVKHSEMSEGESTVLFLPSSICDVLLV
ncbi:hypothetical protein CHUAL_007399 [Chamberlinius hualienensis]